MEESDKNINILKNIYINKEFYQLSVLVGLFVLSLVIVFRVTLHTFWGGKKNTEERTKVEEKREDITNNCGLDAEFDQINLHLQDGLKSCIAQKVESARRDILLKQKEMDDKIAQSKSDKEEELAVIESKYLAEKEEIEEKHLKEIDKVRTMFMAEIYDMKETIQSMKIVLANSDDDEEIVEKTRSELECPVCLEEMKPPRRIWQCSDGHPLCENCRKKPEMNTCPTCRKYLVGRSTIAEKLARALYAPVNQEEQGEEERNAKKIKLF